MPILDADIVDTKVDIDIVDTKVDHRRGPYSRLVLTPSLEIGPQGRLHLALFPPGRRRLVRNYADRVIVYRLIAGIFGWAGAPAAFQVVTRAVQWELRHRLRSSTIMYLDGTVGVCMLHDLDSELALTRSTCIDLLGPTAVADDKTETGRRLDVIGYVIDLDLHRVLIAPKNYLNTLRGFVSVDLDGVMNLRTAQKLASWTVGTERSAAS